jgi:hypothetical protein
VQSVGFKTVYYKLLTFFSSWGVVWLGFEPDQCSATVLRQIFATSQPSINVTNLFTSRNSWFTQHYVPFTSSIHWSDSVTKLSQRHSDTRLPQIEICYWRQTYAKNRSITLQRTGVTISRLASSRVANSVVTVRLNWRKTRLLPKLPDWCTAPQVRLKVGIHL